MVLLVGSLDCNDYAIMLRGYQFHTLPIKILEAKIEQTVSCEDCSLPYQDFPMDITIPDNQWTEITGYTEGEGILCGACIIQRAVGKYGVGRLRFERPIANK